MGTALLVGPDGTEIAEALADAGFAVRRTPIGNRPGLEDAGVHEADVLVLTDLEQATAVTVATDLNPELRVVVYASGSLPDFLTRLTDLLVDPALLDPETVADELARAD